MNLYEQIKQQLRTLNRERNISKKLVLSDDSSYIVVSKVIQDKNIHPLGPQIQLSIEDFINQELFLQESSDEENFEFSVEKYSNLLMKIIKDKKFTNVSMIICEI